MDKDMNMDNDTQRYLGSHEARLDNIDISLKKIDEKLDIFIEFYHKMQAEKAERIRKQGLLDNITSGGVAAIVAGVVTWFLGK